MATYVNNLRLKEIATGDESGTWGTSTNTNLELIADGLGYGTEQVAADSNETFTMADGVADGMRGMYLKFTSAGSLTATRTLTLAPNTVSKVWMIENATTGSQSITIKQGSGAEVTIATGAKAWIYTDGAGAGAAVTLANPTETGTGTVTSVATADGGGVNGITLTGGTITTSGTITLGGTLGSVDLTSQVTGTLPVGNGGTGITSLGTGVATALGVNVGSAGAPLVFDGDAGTPSALVGTNITAMPFSGLAAGTDGELITWDSSGVIAAVAAGDSTQVLTSNGAGAAPTFQAVAAGASVTRTAVTSDTALDADDNGNLVDATANTFTQTFTAAATLGAGWFCYYRNSGTGEVTFNPDGSETIDALTTFVCYPGEARLITCDGSNFFSVVLTGFYIEYTSGANTFTKPPGYKSFQVDLWGAGGGASSGGKGTGGAGATGGNGGGGGSYVHREIKAADIGTTETVTIGAGGSGGAAQSTNGTWGIAGSVGANTTFGSLSTAYGGGQGQAPNERKGGGGGGTLSAGSITAGGEPYMGSNPGASAFGGAWNNNDNEDGYSSGYGGGNGAGGDETDTGHDGGCSSHGGAGGGSGAGLGGNKAGGAGGSRAGESGGGGTGGTTGGSAAGAGSAFEGGGGGYCRSASGAGAGAAGGTAGGGGGGGGGKNDTFNSGAGGAGGAGLARIWGEA